MGRKFAIFAILFSLIITTAYIYAATQNVWQGSIKLTEKPSINPSSVIDEKGNIYVVWEGCGSYEGIYYKFYNASSSIWSDDILLVNGECEEPKIIVDEKIYVIWRENVSGEWKVYFEEINKDGIAVGEKIEVANATHADFVAREGKLYFVWIENGSMYYKMYDSGWYDEQRIDNHSIYSTIIYDLLNEWIHILWIGDKDGNEEVYYTFLNLSLALISYDSDGDGLYDSIENGWTNFSNQTYNDADATTTTDIHDIDSDNDGLPDGWIDGWSYRNGSWGVNYSRRDGIKQPWEGEDLNLNGAVDSGETDPNNIDSDNDGLPDGWEVWYGLNALDSNGKNGSDGDADNDGLTNMQEYENGTSPESNDTDNDGIPDKYEIEHGINPLDSDSDNDGLLDGQENFTMISNLDPDNDGLLPPLDNDSDNDGVMDGSEYYNVTHSWEIQTLWDGIKRVKAGKRNPFNDTDYDGKINMLDDDSDNDGIPDGQEFANGNKPWRPVMRDSDGDGIPDGSEIYGIHTTNMGTIYTDPDNPDSDGDGLLDGREVNYIGGGWWNATSDPSKADSDNDGLLDGQEVTGWAVATSNELIWTHSDPLDTDSDNDGISDYLEYEYGYDASNPDTDNDLLWDSQEDLNKNGVVDYGETNPLNPDCDNDGLLDGDELLMHTDPTNPDTDGDGLLDSLEKHLVTFRTNAIDINGGKSVTETFNGTPGRKREFDLENVASGIDEVRALMHREYTRVLSPSEYTWTPATDERLYGWVNLTFDIGDDDFIVVNYYMHMDPSTKLVQQCDKGCSHCEVYDLGSIINVTYHYFLWENINLEYIPSIDYNVYFNTSQGRNVVRCTLPNGSYYDLNDTQYTYANYTHDGHILNRIVTGYAFYKNENLTVYYTGGYQIDYKACSTAWIAVAKNITTTHLIAKSFVGNFLTDDEVSPPSYIQVTHTPEGYGVYYNESQEIFVIDVPGNENPLYDAEPSNETGDVYLPWGIFHYTPPLTGRGSIYEFAQRNQETYTNIFSFDPGNPDTNNDGLLDSENIDLVFVYGNHNADHDGDGIIDWEDNDTDNDGVLNGEEAFWNKDTEWDMVINAYDNNSDNNSIANTGDDLLDGEEAKVIFRTDSTRTENLIPVPHVSWDIYYTVNDYYGAKVAIYNSSDPSKLDEYHWAGEVAYNNATMALQPYNYTFMGTEKQIYTPEKYGVYRDAANSSIIYIDIPDGYGDFSDSLKNGTTLVKFVRVNWNLIDLGRDLNSTYASQHQEVYDFTYALTSGSRDDDNDDLPTDGTGPDPNDGNPDIDGDGLKDGYERNWDKDEDGDGLTNINDVDSDNDGLPDGWIDGWGYNATKASLHQHAPGTIDGWGIWYPEDGIKQPWEGEDLNCNGRKDVNETDMLSNDSDGDGFMDGEEIVIYHMNPLTGDTDNDGLSDFDELYSYFAVDTINVVRYGNKSIDEIGWWEYLIPHHNITIPARIPFNATYHIWTEPTGANLEINGSKYYGVDEKNPAQVALTRGILNITLLESTSSPIVHMVIAKKGCNLTNPDSDGDGIPDGEEMGSPLDVDSDNDGLKDNEEQVPHYYTWLGHRYHTITILSRPDMEDTDGDGVWDKYDPVKNGSSYLNFTSYIFPPSSVIEKKTFRGWGLDGHSWIIHSLWTDDRGREDVKVSDMDNLSKVEENILKVLPSWYRILPGSIKMVGDAFSTKYNDTWMWEDPTGYPKYKIEYDYLCKLYNVTIYNEENVIKDMNGNYIGIRGLETLPPHFVYATEPIDIETNKTQYIVITYSLDNFYYDGYFNNESSYKIGVFEYRLYYESNGSINFFDNPMHYKLLASQGYATPVEIDGRAVRSTYSIRIPINKEIAKQREMWLYLSPVYVVKDGACSKDKRIEPWNLYGIKIAGMEKIVPQYSYRVISKLNENISEIDAILPAVETYATGNYSVAGYTMYVYNGTSMNFKFHSFMLSKDLIAIVSSTEAEVNKIISMINFTSEWKYEVSSPFNESMSMSEFKSITNISYRHYVRPDFSHLSSWRPYYGKINMESNMTSIAKHNNSRFNYTIISTTSHWDGWYATKRIHIVREQSNETEAKMFADSKYNDIKNIFKAKPDGSMLSSDGSFVIVIAPHKQPDGSIVMETFSTISSLYGIGTGIYGAFDTFTELREINKITNPIKKAEKISKFMTPDVGPLEVADFAFSAIDLILTWSNAFEAKDKFITRAAGEHTVAVVIDVGISAAGIAFPPAGVVGITWTATYYGMVGGMSVLGIHKGPYLEYASDPGEAIVFSFIVFTGVTMPSEFAQEAFQDAEQTILTHYMNSTQFINAKNFYDEECGTWYTIEPYYPQFYIDPR